MPKSLNIALFILFLTFSFQANVHAQSETKWEILGYQKVNFLADKGIIKNKMEDKLFSAVRLSFQGEIVDMHHLTIHFGNGEMQTVPLKKKFRDTSVSKIMDLYGGSRKISHVTYYYKPNHFAEKKAYIEVIGKAAVKEESSIE